MVDWTSRSTAFLGAEEGEWQGHQGPERVRHGRNSRLVPEGVRASPRATTRPSSPHVRIAARADVVSADRSGCLADALVTQFFGHPRPVWCRMESVSPVFEAEAYHTESHSWQVRSGEFRGIAFGGFPGVKAAQKSGLHCAGRLIGCAKHGKLEA